MKSNLTSEERKKLLYMVQEMQSRGIEVPKESLALLESHDPEWPVDPDGYFIKRDGTQFVPYEEQEKFILSRAVLSQFRSGRGGGKTGAGAQKALRKIIFKLFSEFIISVGTLLLSLAVE